MDIRKNQLFDIQQWECQENYTTYRIFRNLKSGIHCQQYLLPVASQKDRQNFDRRKSNQQNHIVKVYDCEAFSNYNSNGIFSHYSLRVYIERLTLRINQLKSLTMPLMVQYLIDTLKGFHRIFQQYQPVRISAQMIGLNELNKVKVWLSPDLIQNYVNVCEYVNQKVMVKDIFIVYDRFSSFFEDRPLNMNFSQSFTYINYKINQRNNQSNGLFSEKSIDNGRRKALMSQVNAQQLPDLKKIVSQQTQRPVSVHTYKNVIAQQKKFLKKQNPNSILKNFGQKLNGEKTSALHINIESARTTSKNVSVSHQNLIQLDQNELQKELIDEKKSKQYRIYLIEKILSRQKRDINTQKICAIFKHALKFDPLMYNQLIKVQGKISKITNKYMLNRILMIIQQQCNKPNNNQSDQLNNLNLEKKIKLDDSNEQNYQQYQKQQIKNILQQQRIKRNRILSSTTQRSETKKQKNLQRFKEEVQKLLFD